MISGNSELQGHSGVPSSAPGGSAGRLPVIPRAPAIAVKLEAAREALRAHDSEVAQAVLDAAEAVPGGTKRLADLRARISTAEREVGELTKAHDLAVRLDRQADAAAAASTRADQLRVFKGHMTAREKAMASVMTAAAAMAKAYGEYSEATSSAATAVPSGTVVPTMMIGEGGFAGAAFGPCERLILAELYRLGPQRKDGAGRFILPFSKPPGAVTALTPDKIAPGIDALVTADRAIVAEIEIQITRRNETEQAAAKGKAA